MVLAKFVMNCSLGISPGRYAPLMTQRLFIILIIFLLTSCNNKQRSGEWNLNQTVGWKSINPNDYTVLLIRWSQTIADSTQISNKKKWDEAVLKELKSNHLGDEVENDQPTETDLHFMVSKDYKNALEIILSVAKDFGVEQKVTVYKRDYDSFSNWADTIVYPE